MNKIKSFFLLDEKHTSFKQEILAAITVFISLAYIIVLNPQILSSMGLDFGALMVATIIITAATTVFMGLFANLPITIAPALGVSAFCTYTIFLKQGYSPSLILTACVPVGLLLFILNILKIRQKILNSIPKPIFTSLIVGIGLFLIMVGLSQVSVIIPKEGHVVKFGSFHHLPFYLTMAGFIGILMMLKKGVKGAFIYTLLSLWIVSLFLKITPFVGIISLPPSLLPSLHYINFSELMNTAFYEVFFSLFLVSLFDSSAGILLLAKMLFPHGKMPNMQRALTPDSIGTTVAPFIGLPTLAIHLESAAGITIGGRTGFSAIVTGFLFFLCLFFYPLISSIPPFASAPVLLTIGYMMCREIRHLDWKDFTSAIPAIITIAIMPITFSIYLGFAAGFISYCGLKVLTGKFKEINLYTAILTFLFCIHLIFLY